MTTWPAAWRRPHLTLLAAALAAAGLVSLPVAAAPEGGQLRAGQASIGQSGSQTRIDQHSERAVIDWRSFSVGAAEQVLFVQPSASSATLNRVTGDQASLILGRIDANGQVFLINPNGIVFGRGAQLDVAGLVASTANIGNADFMAGRLDFRQPGAPGAGVLNQGHITAAEGGLVALVAPHVRNDGVIQARLGRVVLGAGERFALDLHGDGLISLAVDPARSGPLFEADGRPVTSLVNHTGEIRADGGRVVLVTAATARAALDQVINLSGTVRADTVEQQGGRIVLLARGGSADVSGQLSAQGLVADQSGGTIEVLGAQVNLAAGAVLDASGQAGGGVVHVGGAWQGAPSPAGHPDAPRSTLTVVADGARVAADARERGNGGEVVLWSDGATDYSGQISARGGSQGGHGGRVEVSGRETLRFMGLVDAGAAPGGQPGSLLLDPAVMTIGLAEASLINRVLRTGTSTTVSAELDIILNAMIDGRGRRTGGGLTLNAGRDITLNEHIVTADGDVRLNAGTGTVRIAGGRGVFAGRGDITVNTGGDLSAGVLVTQGTLRLNSSGGSVALDTPLDAGIGPVVVTAAQDVRINQPVVSLRDGSPFSVTAGRDVYVNAQVDGRSGNPGAASGTLMLQAGGTVHLDESVVTQLADIRLRAIAGSILTAPDRGAFTAGGGNLELVSGADLTPGIVGAGGALLLRSTAGSVTLAQGIAPTVGTVTIEAAQDVNLDSDVLNLRNGSALGVSAGRDIRVRGQIDGRPEVAGEGRAGGGVTLTAGRNVSLENSITTREGPIGIAATGGSVSQGAGVQLRSGAAPISVSSAGTLVSGSYVTSGALSLQSTAGSVLVAVPIYDSTGATTLRAAADVWVQAASLVENVRTGAELVVDAGRDVVVDAQVGQDRNATTATGPITLTAGRDVRINHDVVTRDAALTINAIAGTVTVANSVAGQPDVAPQVRSGNGALSVTAGADLRVGDPAAARPNPATPYVTTGALSLSSAGGTLFIEAPIPASTGRVSLHGGNAVRVNERVYSNGQDIFISAGAGGIVMSGTGITVRDPGSGTDFSVLLGDVDARQGNLTLQAQGDIVAPSVRTAGTLSITSSAGRIVSGRVLPSRSSTFSSLGMPQQVLLSGAQGIDAFDTGTSPDVVARSSQGSVNLSVFFPQRLYVQAAGDVSSGGFLGARVELVAGNDVRLSDIAQAGLVRVNAGRDFAIDGLSIVGSLSASAGRDVRLPTVAGRVTWVEGSGGDITLRDPASPGAVTLRGLTLNAGRDVLAAQPIHVSDVLFPSTVETVLQPTTITAGRHVNLAQLETIGDVSLTAGTGNVTLGAPLGGPVTVNASLWNPANVGVRSLSVSAPGSGAAISLQGVRSVGDVNLSAPSGSVTSAFAVTSSTGVVSITAPVRNLSATPIPLQNRLSRPPLVSPPVAPSPLRAGPDAPLIPAAPAPAAPGLAEVLVSAPASIDAGAASLPGGSGAASDPNGALAGQASRAVGSASDDEAPVAAGDAAVAEKGVLVYSGGRGAAQSVDLGRSGSYGRARGLDTDADDKRQRRAGAAKR